jgi:resuscitation-promoting factor RpfB
LISQKKGGFRSMLKEAKELISELGKRNNLTIKLASALVLTSSIGTGTYQGLKDTVQVDIEGQQEIVRTHAETVGDLLKEKKIELRVEDKISPSIDTTLTDDMDVKIDLAHPIELVIDGQKQSLWTTANTVNDLLNEQQVVIGEHDEVFPSREAKIEDNTQIIINKAFPMTLDVGGKKEQTWSTSTTVADFLNKKQITLNELDRVEPSLNEVVTENSMVKVIRVEKVTDVVEEPISYAVVKQNDANLDSGVEQVRVQGENGTKQKTMEVVKENGKEISRTVVNEQVTKEAKNQVIATGTRQGSVAREMMVTATAYAASQPGNQGLTAGGYNIQQNPGMKLIAVDPRIIPLGTKVWVEGYGYAIAGDTGGAIKGNKIDVLLPTISQVYNWGRKQVKIKILN